MRLVVAGDLVDTRSMNDLTMTAFLSAGPVTADDNVLGLIQGLDQDQARGIAEWLALASNGPAVVRFISMLSGTSTDIRVDPVELRARMEQIRAEQERRNNT